MVHVPRTHIYTAIKLSGGEKATRVTSRSGIESCDRIPRIISNSINFPSTHREDIRENVKTRDDKGSTKPSDKETEWWENSNTKYRSNI